MKTYLNVPYTEKDMAKNLGARFDMSKKQWFVPDGIDLVPFVRWVKAAPKLSKAIRRILKSPI